MISEAHGIPLAVSLTGGNRNDITQLMPLLQAIPPVRGRRGRPRQRPDALYADRGYDHDKYRRQVRSKGVTPVIARRGTEHGSGLGTYRWVIEQSVALLHWFRRLRIRWEIRDDIHEAFLDELQQTLQDLFTRYGGAEGDAFRLAVACYPKGDPDDRA